MTNSRLPMAGSSMPTRRDFLQAGLSVAALAGAAGAAIATAADAATSPTMRFYR